jgi:hypothetical protein
MENNNLSNNVEFLISHILAEGLESWYDEVLTFLSTDHDDKDLLLLFSALDVIREDSVLLRLKISELRNRILFNALSTPEFLKPDADGFIRFTKNNHPTTYYTITPELLRKIIFCDVPLPPKGQTKLYHERIVFTKNDVDYESTRQFEIDENGHALQVVAEECIPLNHRCMDDENSPIDNQTIYGGILGDILTNAKQINNNDEELVTKD